MNERSRLWRLWAPRILAILVCLYLSVFAFDAFEPGKAFGDALADFALHVAPMIVLSVVVAVAWRWEWVGAFVFTGLGVAYTFVAGGRIAWVLAISAPLLVVGVLYGWNWRHHRELHARA